MASTVMVVDDEAVVADVLATALSDEGFDVLIAANGVHALDLLAQHPETSLVISDFMMPKLDGHALLRAMKASHIHRSILSILMSAMPEPILLKKELGYSAFISKPFSISAVVILVQRILCADLI